ncbi:unnamed protein product [Cyprideis torosa]|uniref:Uncharacterized protein n=1 Tax=Cyprideis torosa TaxID=163714 RepID=A0A7R8ZYS6_9CRUS|nr:unnamed protein product [Cyprideis torosa]CAG0908775.1 unnamed protein product [Cyprideis torosa]
MQGVKKVTSPASAAPAKVISSISGTVSSSAVAADYQLVLVEQPGCAYCAAWDDQIAPAYPNTAEGAFAPLIRADLHIGPPDGVSYARRVNFTPTFILAISHEGRLMILCHLVSGEKSVTELEDLLSARQAAVSQQLSRLRLEGLVIPRRDGKTIYYRLADDKPRKMLECVYDLFCRDDD